MDWHSWLSRSTLHPSLINEYAIVFAHNELELEDTMHFTHEFLQSMGITIAKHRLEILKLIRDRRPKPPFPVAKLVAVMKKTKKCLTNYIHALSQPSASSSALVVVPKAPGGGGGRWGMRRRRRGGGAKEERLMITNGGASGVQQQEGGEECEVHSSGNGGSPMVYSWGESGSYSGEEEEGEEVPIRWDSMFHNLRPT